MWTCDFLGERQTPTAVPYRMNRVGGIALPGMMRQIAGSPQGVMDGVFLTRRPAVSGLTADIDAVGLAWRLLCLVVERCVEACDGAGGAA
jgi:hypothetical protein